MKAEYKQDVELICKLNRKWEPATIRVKRLGGQTNRNYLVISREPFDKFRASKFFVRLPWERVDVINRKVEGKNIVALAKNKKLAGILPRYHTYILKKKNILAPKSSDVFGVPDGTMVTEFLEGQEFTFRMFKQKKYQEALAKTLHIFHTSGIRFGNPYDVLRDEVKKYRFAAMEYPSGKFLGRETVRELLEIEKEVEQKLTVFKRGISTHNDVIFQNILAAKNGRLYFLDFEYAGLNKRGGIFYDLGYVFRDSFFKPPRISQKTFEQFLSVADRAYGKKLDRSQIYWAVIAALLVGIWWGVLRYVSVPPKERAYFHAYVRRGIQGVLGLYSKIKNKGQDFS